MTAAEAIVVVLACAGGAALQATAGFGFALLAAPALVRVLHPAEAIGVIGVLSVLINALTLATGRGPRDGRTTGAGPILTMELIRMAPPAAVGLVAGALLLGVVPDAVLQAALAVAVLAALLTRRRDAADAPPPRQAWRVLAAFSAGVMTTTIGVNGPPLVLWLRALRPTPAQLRATLALAFLVAGAATVVVLAALGDLHAGPGTILLCAAAVLAGHTAGRWQAASMALHRHERVVTGALALSAVAAAASAISGCATPRRAHAAPPAEGWPGGRSLGAVTTWNTTIRDADPQDTPEQERTAFTRAAGRAASSAG
ncbi:MAG: hypothetical protein JWO02_4206 [Solirubrobacterales bacterium]|nr:hypothetical protein [Solirubrobacterales bacterium]